MALKPSSLGHRYPDLSSHKLTDLSDVSGVVGVHGRLSVQSYTVTPALSPLSSGTDVAGVGALLSSHKLTSLKSSMIIYDHI